MTWTEDQLANLDRLLRYMDYSQTAEWKDAAKDLEQFLLHLVEAERQWLNNGGKDDETD